MDTSVFVGYLRAGRHGEFLRREIARGAVFLPGVVLYELQGGMMRWAWVLQRFGAVMHVEAFAP